MMKKQLIYVLIGLVAALQSLSAQTSDIVRGKVVSETGEELISLAVLEVDKNDRVVSSVLTDLNGEFSMKIKSRSNRLRFQYLGFTQQNVAIGDRMVFNITMRESNVLQEVVIKSTATMTDGTFNIPVKEIPFAMQKINTKEFEGIQVASIDDALQGRIAGLDIVGSGEVGKASSMRLRGTSSINSNQNPLIVMNNVPIEVNMTDNFDVATATEEQFADLLNINPEDIESITVLKDAASTAVWGSRGANGVLMINTKKGAKGPTRVTYTYRYTGAEQPTGMKMLTGGDYLSLMEQAYTNTGRSTAYRNIPEYQANVGFSEFQYYTANTTWRDKVIQYGSTNDHYVNISGGGDKARFRLGAGYYKQDGTVIGQALDRITSRMVLDYDVSSKIHFTSEFAFTYADTKRNYDDILDVAYKMMPNMAVYHKDAYGNVDGYYNILQSSRLPNDQKALRNPVASANLAVNDSKSWNVQPILRLQYDFFDPDEQTLRYAAWVSFNIKTDKTHKFLPKELSTAEWSNNQINRADDYDSGSFGIQSENSLTWQSKFDNPDHNLMLYASLQTSSGRSNYEGAVTFGYPSTNITDPSAEGFLSSISSGIGQWRSIGLIGRAHYAFKSKYVLDFTFRRDGSTKFGKGNKWGNFPGVSLRWNISDEPFMDFSNKWLDMLALRGSWGISGNAPGAEYLHFSQYGVWSSYNGVTTFRPENIRLSNLKWEKTMDNNLGFNFAFLDYTYTMDLDLYTRKTSDLLFQNSSLPTSTGFSTLSWRNSGSMRNDGFDLNIQGQRFAKIGNVSFDFVVNFANSINTLIELDDDILRGYNKDPDYNAGGEYLQRLQEGNAYGSIYGYRYKGVYRFNIDSYKTGWGNIPVDEFQAKVNSGEYTMPIVRNAEGQPVFDSKGNPIPIVYAYDPLTNTTPYEVQGGDAIYEDINHDGNIDALDIVYLGNSNPKITGGWGFTARWKQLSVKIFSNFRYGNKIINAARMYAENMDGSYNQSIAVNYRWRKEGDPSDGSNLVLPRALYDAPYKYNWLGSDRYVEDGSFMRIKYITFNYSVPSSALKRFYAKQLNFYLTINNIYTFTSYTGVDPEVNYGGMGISRDNSTTPRSHDFTLGITLGF
jgi:TonB-linked SusC/RagA family outer membrane protein